MDILLKETLSQMGMTLKESAASSGIDQSNLSYYINGKISISPTLGTLNRIANNLNVDSCRTVQRKRGSGIVPNKQKDIFLNQ